jgi:prophage antirepressor-like protein
MNTELQTFAFHGHALRIFPTDDGQSFYAVAKDATDILDYQTAKDGLRSVPDKHKGRRSVPTHGGLQEMLCVDEPGLYRLILRSDKPEAEPLMEYVTSEVLPSIRKTGGYRTAEAADKLQRELNKAQKQTQAIEAYWFGKYPHWRIIRRDYYIGYPFKYIARMANKSVSACRRAVKSMEARGLINPRYAALHRLPHGAYELWLIENPKLGW